MNFKIKKFGELTPDELYEILRIRNEVFVIEQTCIFQDCDQKDQKSYHLFSIDNGKIIAYLRILEKGVSYSEISIGRVLVDKKYRGKGLARDILLKSLDFIENDLNEKEIRISAQKYLVDFYESLGFSIASDVYLEDGIPHIDMFYNNIIN